MTIDEIRSRLSEHARDFGYSESRAGFIYSLVNHAEGEVAACLKDSLVPSENVYNSLRAARQFARELIELESGVIPEPPVEHIYR